MIEALERLPEGERPQADVCVVGAGPAGITLALDLAERGLSVVLLESGLSRPHAPTQSLCRGEVADARLHAPPERHRVRGLGGTSAVWNGCCVPMDPLDFEARPQMPLSGWPIGWSELAPFYARANEWAEAGRFAYRAPEALPGAPPLIAGFQSEQLCTDGLERYSCPTLFGVRYRHRLELASRVRVLLGATCTHLQLAEDSRSLSAVLAESLRGRRVQVRARATVLATGGLETARLLLASKDVARAGIGNAHDVVGRYYMCQIAGRVGLLEVQGDPARVRHGCERSPEGVPCRRRLALVAAEQQRLGLANLAARLVPAHAGGAFSRLALWHARRPRRQRYSLEVHAEQRPLASSRVTLVPQRDALGLPRLRVDWRCDPEDIASVRRSLDQMVQAFEASGAARLSYHAEALEQDLLRLGACAGHHLGTARMGSDPRTSVVDAHGQVHGVRNLFVAGSAVFPTSGQAHPTLTLLALALRLGAHLQERLQWPAALHLDSTAPTRKAALRPQDLGVA